MELEYKFELEDFSTLYRMSQPAPWQPFASSRPGGKCHMHSYYFDTADRALDSLKTVLRLRREGTERVMTLKFQTGASAEAGLFEREEIEIRLDTDDAVPPVEAFWRCTADFEQRVPAAIRAALCQPMLLCYEVRFARQRRYLQYGDSVIALDLDQGFVCNPKRERPFLEAELELISGLPADLACVAAYTRRRFSLQPQPLSKYQQCRQLDRD